MNSLLLCIIVVLIIGIVNIGWSIHRYLRTKDIMWWLVIITGLALIWFSARGYQDYQSLQSRAVIVPGEP